MRCPNCGSPAMVYGNRWECGYCGDSGDLSARQGAEEITFDISLEFVNTLDFQEVWGNMKDCVRMCATQLLPQLYSVLIYEITHALAAPGHILDDQKFQALRQFLQTASDLKSSPSLQDIRLASQQCGELCTVQGILTRDVCGTFWQQLIDILSPGEYPAEIDQLLHALSECYQFFASDEDALTRFYELRDAFELHWYRHQYFYPNRAAAEERLQNDDTSRIEEDCRDILVSSCPEFFREFSVEDMEDFQWSCLLENLAEDDPILARNMWEAILTAAKTSPTVNPNVDEYLSENNPFAER